MWRGGPRLRRQPSLPRYSRHPRAWKSRASRRRHAARLERGVWHASAQRRPPKARARPNARCSGRDQTRRPPPPCGGAGGRGSISQARQTRCASPRAPLRGSARPPRETRSPRKQSRPQKMRGRRCRGGYRLQRAAQSRHRSRRSHRRRPWQARAWAAGSRSSRQLGCPRSVRPPSEHERRRRRRSAPAAREPLQPCSLSEARGGAGPSDDLRAKASSRCRANAESCRVGAHPAAASRLQKAAAAGKRPDSAPPPHPLLASAAPYQEGAERTERGRTPVAGSHARTPFYVHTHTAGEK